MTALFEVLWKSGVALGVTLCVTLLLRKKSAALRRLILSTAVIAMFLATITLPVLPRWSPPMPVSVIPPPAISAAPASTQHSSLLPSMPTPAPPPHTDWPSELPALIPSIWLLGTALLLTRLLAGLHGLRRMRNASHSLDEVMTTAPGNVSLLETDAIAAPVTWGIIRPVILVPSGFKDLPAESRNAVLCHELAHIHGYDFLLRMLAEIACSLIWFQPLMWIVSRRLREEQELACDDRVLASGVRPSAYAKLLLNWDLTPGPGSIPAIGMANRSSLKRRLYALLDRDINRERVAAPAILTTWTLAIAATLPLAAVTWTHPSTPMRSKMPRTREPAVTMPAAAAPIRIAQARPTPRVPSPVARTMPAALFVASSMLVVEDVTVNSQDGKLVQGLTASDFTVTEDEKEMQPVFAEMGLVLFDANAYAPPRATGKYVVGYYTPNDKAGGAYRRVKLSLKNSNARLDYRAGYYAPSLTPTGTYEPLNMPADVNPPELITKVEPAYSDEARNAKVSGVVALDADVDASGRAANIRVIRPLGFGLDENAIDALKRWRFRPASKDGAPVSAPVRIEMNFRLL